MASSSRKTRGRVGSRISLRGEADFHVLRFLGNQVYGYDATNERLMVSGDGGKSWEQRQVPGPLIDLAADPGKPRHLLAASERDLHVSRDDGRSWEQLSLAPGLLAWPSERTLYLIDGAGAVYVSRDAGGSFTSVGEVGGQPAALVTEGERELYAALHDATIEVSTDGGVTWAIRSAP